MREALRMIRGLHELGMSGAAMAEHRLDYIKGQKAAFREGRFDEVGEVLASAALETLDDVTLVMLVRPARIVRERVPAWDETVRRVTAEFDRRGKDGRAIFADIYAEDPSLDGSPSQAP